MTRSDQNIMDKINKLTSVDSGTTCQVKYRQFETSLFQEISLNLPVHVRFILFIYIDGTSIFPWLTIVVGRSQVGNYNFKWVTILSRMSNSILFLFLSLPSIKLLFCLTDWTERRRPTKTKGTKGIPKIYFRFFPLFVPFNQAINEQKKVIGMGIRSDFQI